MLISFVIKNWILFWWMQNLMMQYLWTEMRNEMILKKPFFTIQIWKPVSNIVQSWNGLPKALSNSFIQFSFLSFLVFIHNMTISEFKIIWSFCIILNWLWATCKYNFICLSISSPLNTFGAFLRQNDSNKNGYVLNDTILTANSRLLVLSLILHTSLSVSFKL